MALSSDVGIFGIDDGLVGWVRRAFLRRNPPAESQGRNEFLGFAGLFNQLNRGSRHKKARRGFPHRKSGLPDLRTDKKTDPGQARDRRTLREFQFHE
jgi:hypothetical protein